MKVFGGHVARALAALGCCLWVTTSSVAARAEDRAATSEMTVFKAWLDSARAGYGCDEGPARFRNSTVESAYRGRRFYYVLTYTRGIPPPYQHPTTVLADLTEGRVRPIHPVSVDAYRLGLIKVSSAKDARLAAAAVMILATVDPNERRWRYDPNLFKAKKSGGKWVCTYAHGSALYVTRVTFDKAGGLVSFQSGAPPVP